MIALVAVFALLAQALAPGFAVAGSSPDGGDVICTTMGLQAPGDSAPPSVDHACKHCVCPAPADLPPAAATAARVAYAAIASPATAANRALPPPARGPPRPHGQGPPVPNA